LRVIFRVFTVSAIAVFAAAAAGQTVPKRSSPDAQVRKAIAEWADAVRVRDPSRLEALFADDLFITDYNGGTRGKREELDVLKPDPGNKTISVVNDDLVVRLLDGQQLALVTAVVRMVFEAAGGKETQFSMRYTSLWQKRAGRWQLTVLHTSRAPAK